MHILVVTQYFWPENFRINDLCDEFIQRGHDVTILTGRPNYPAGVVFDEYKKKPSLFNQFKGCKIVRVPMIVRGKRSGIRLVFNYMSFALSASIIGAFKLRKQQYDIIFVFEPSPITVGLPAIVIKKLKKIPIVFWVLDLWPETLEAIGVIKSKNALNLVGKLVSFIYNRCDLILGQSKAFLDNIAYYCSDKEKIRYFPSWSEDIFTENRQEQAGELTQHGEAFKVLFAGNVGEAQDFSNILRAAELLKARKVKVKLFIVGDGRMSDWLSREVDRKELSDYVYLLGRYAIEDMPKFYTAADALLVTLKDSPVFSMTIPGKLQSYMTAGKPILTMLTGEGSRVVSDAHCGYVAGAGDYNCLADNIVKMMKLSHEELASLGENARRYANQEFDRAKLINQLERWFVEYAEMLRRKSR